MYHLYLTVRIALIKLSQWRSAQLMADTDFAQEIGMWEEEVLCVAWHGREKQDGKFEQKK